MTSFPSLIIDRPFIISHRGLADENVEKSSSAINDTNDTCDLIKIDIRQNSDGEFVLFNDETLEGLAGVNKKIREITYDELFEHSIHDSDEEILSLEDAVSKISVPILAEIKETYTLEDIEKIVDLTSRTHYQSFSPDIIRDVSRYVSCALGLICSDSSYENQTDTKTVLGPFEGIDFVEEHTGTFVSIPYKLVTEEVVSYAHERDIAVFVWDLNSSEEVERMRFLGIDGLIVDTTEIVRS